MKIRAEGVSRQYFRLTKETNVFYALQPTDLELEGGTLTVIYGRSGSGKSTLLNVMAGLLEPTEGKVLLGDAAGTTDVYALSDDARSLLRNRHIGVIPQGRTGLQALTVRENVLLPTMIAPGAAAGIKEAEMLLEELEILHLRDIYPNELSGGEARRMAIARALINRPGILLADEPTGDLDDENTTAVLQLLRRCADDGMAVLLVTHEPEAESYGDVCYHMDGGLLKFRR